MKRICFLDNCQSKHKGRNLCAKHYESAKRGVTTWPDVLERRCMLDDGRIVMLPNPKNPQSMTLEERLDTKTDKETSPKGCWEWLGGQTGNGHGQLSYRNKKTLVHRLSYERFIGDIAEGMVVDHLCHNRLCLNPKHLRAVTHSENSQNRASVQDRNVSGVREVYYQKGRSKWLVTIGHKGKNVYVGTYETLGEAKAAREAKERELFTPLQPDYLGI